jgi:hypothetical protein
MTTQLANIQKNQEELIIREIENTQKLCASLMRTPHYAKMGETGIYAIIQKAKSIGMNPLEALNGGMYFVQGKVEMQGQAMLAIIRAHGHSVSMDPKSTDICVRMFGKRCDNGDTWMAQFSVEDAKRQGIFRNQWEKMPKVMCMWRCVSQLSRFLFSDLLKGVYVQGEISEALASENKVEFTMDNSIEISEKVEAIDNKPSNEQAIELEEMILKCNPKYQENVEKYLNSMNLSWVGQLPLKAFESLKNRTVLENAAPEEPSMICNNRI